MTANQKSSSDINQLSGDLGFINEHVYKKCDFDLMDLRRNKESEEYDACSFRLNDNLIQYRASKITPTKVGQFVTIWKRNAAGVTEPFNVSDDFDFIMITSRRDRNLGQFIFPKQVLAERGIVTQNENQGKRGIRVYAPWDLPVNKQAQKTQEWQIRYFITIAEDSSTDLNLVRALFELE